MTKSDFDPIVIHYAIIDSWPITALYTALSFLYVQFFPHLLGDSIGMSILCGGVALVPLTLATFLFWCLEERWNVWIEVMNKNRQN